MYKQIRVTSPEIPINKWALRQGFREWTQITKSEGDKGFGIFFRDLWRLRNTIYQLSKNEYRYEEG